MSEILDCLQIVDQAMEETDGDVHSGRIELRRVEWRYSEHDIPGDAAVADSSDATPPRRWCGFFSFELTYLWVL